MELEALHQGLDMTETVTRARFEELNADLFKKTLGPGAPRARADAARGRAGRRDDDTSERALGSIFWI